MSTNCTALEIWWEELRLNPPLCSISVLHRRHQVGRRMSDGGGRAVCRISKSCTPWAVRAPCVGYRCDPQMCCSSQQSQPARTAHTHRALHTLTHDPAVSQRIGTGLHSFPRCLMLKPCRHIPCKARDSHLSSGFSAPAPRATFPGLAPHKGQH